MMSIRSAMDEISALSPTRRSFSREPMAMVRYGQQKQDEGVSTSKCDKPQLQAVEADTRGANKAMGRFGLPPSYEASPHPAHIRHKFDVQPREDEGREVLPAYSTAISLETVFSRKMEYDGAIHRANDRHWYSVYATLQGTALSFHKARQNVFSKPDSTQKPSADYPVGSKRGAFLGSYNLALADVGIAADYRKKKYVIRIRAEADQFLLSCERLETFVTWLQTLFVAINLALPLDDRQIPKDQSIPRSHRRRRRSHRVVEINENFIRQQEDIIRAHYPGLASAEEGTASVPTPSAVDSPQRSRDQDCEASRPASTVLNTYTNTSLALLREMGLMAPESRLRRLRVSRRVPTPASTTSTRRRFSIMPKPNMNSDETEDGKWRPQHDWDSTYDIIYAKKCMAVLTETSPRKSRYMVFQGKKWLVDWERGLVRGCEPPGYGQTEVETFILGPLGKMIRI